MLFFSCYQDFTLRAVSAKNVFVDRICFHLAWSGQIWSDQIWCHTGTGTSTHWHSSRCKSMQLVATNTECIQPMQQTKADVTAQRSDYHISKRTQLLRWPFLVFYQYHCYHLHQLYIVNLAMPSVKLLMCGKKLKTVKVYFILGIVAWSPSLTALSLTIYNQARLMSDGQCFHKYLLH